MGRNSKYNYTDHQFLLNIEGLARDGWDDKQICEKYHLNETYFCELKNKYPELNEALKRGRSPLDIHVENSLYKRAVGLKIITVVRKFIIDENGNETEKVIVQETETQLPPDTGACMAWLKQRKPEKWNKQPIKIEQTNIDYSDLIELPDFDENNDK